MIRVSKHILKFQTEYKNTLLNQLFDDFYCDLQSYIKLIIDEKLPLKTHLSSKECPNLILSHPNWKILVYNQASSIIRSQIKRSEERRYKRYKQIYAICKERNKFNNFTNMKFKELRLKNIFKTKYFIIPNIHNFSIELPIDRFNIKNFNNSFDEWVKLYLPYKNPKYKSRGIQINLPIKHYDYMKKYMNNGWKRKNTIILFRNKKGQIFVNYIFEKEEPKLKENGTKLGLDQGYHKLLSDSNGNHYGTNLQDIYEKLSKKKQGSKNFNQLLIHRDNEINKACNSLDLSNINELVIENLKYVKSNSKEKGIINHKTMNKLQRWSYNKTINKLEHLCEENGILLTKVNPAYTSQTCSQCGYLDKSARNKEIYQCKHCGLLIDADTNGAINILHRGVYNPSNPKNLIN